MSINVRVSWALLKNHLIMYWRILDIWSAANIVASCVTELDNTLPLFMGVQWDSVQATHGVFAEAYARKDCTRVR
jgi:ABC-type sulfate transport system permease subunit